MCNISLTRARLNSLPSSNIPKSEVTIVIFIMNNTFIAILLAFTTMPALSYTSHSGGYVSISDLRAYEGDYVLFKAPSSNNDDNCDASSNWIKLSITTEAGKRQFSMLLSARMANAPVMLYYKGCSSGGSNGYRLVEQVQI